MSPEVLHKFARAVPHNSVAWFDLLDRLGRFENWLASDSKAERNYAIWLLGAPVIMQQRSERIAGLIKPILSNDAERRGEVLTLFDFGSVHSSREFFDLFITLLKGGAFDDANQHLWMHLHDIADKNPAMAVELVGACLDRLLQRAKDAGSESPFREESGGRSIRLDADIFETAVRQKPDIFVKQILPRVANAIQEYAVTTEDGRTLDRAWPYRSFGYLHDFSELLFYGLTRAMATLARDTPGFLDQQTRGLESLPHVNIAFLLLSAWSENGCYYADKTIEFLLADPTRLNIGLSSWSEGNGTAAVSRAAIKSASPFCSEGNFVKLEAAILDYFPQVEHERPKALGYTQYLLLHVLDIKRMTAAALKRLQEHSRKFPEIITEMPSQGDRGGFVGSPIPDDAAKKMSDDQWLSAMRAYPDCERKTRTPKDFLKGGARELSRQLESETKFNKTRFAELALRMDADIQPIYYDAILRGLVAKEEKQPQVGVGGVANSKILPVETSAATNVIRHFHQLAGQEVARWVCSAIADLAERELPEDLLQILIHYAKSHPDPPPDEGKRDPADIFFNPVSRGINSTRGAVAHAFACLLWADPRRFEHLEGAIDALAADPSIAVRACLIECLLPMLNFQREKAVRLFLEITRSSDEIIGTLFVERFLYYVTVSHFLELRDLFQLMLSAADAEIRAVAAKMIALASFRYEEAANDLRDVLSSDEACRAAVAEVDAASLRLEECRAVCRSRLVNFFRDDSAKVREQASHCFRQVSDRQLSDEGLLIDAFLHSPAFQENANELVWSLEKSVAKLPDVVCRILERAVEVQQSSNRERVAESRWWTHNMADLVLRLYEQTIDEGIKVRCLNVIDDMIELEFGGITGEMAKIER